MSEVLARQFVFVVGAPRSGTTWLHRMLAAHPDVAAMEQEELTVFTRYAGTWLRNYQQEQRAMREGRWRQGLPTIWDEPEFDRAQLRFVGEVYAKVLARNPTATHILDKSPNYANHLHVVDRYLPTSRIVHLIRDGREVAVSMMSANERIGHSPGDVRTAAREWHRCVTNAQAYGKKLGKQRYLEVRYDKLMGDTTEELRRIHDFMGVTSSNDDVTRVVAAYHISRNPVSRGDERNKALRQIPGAIWRIRLSLAQRRTFDRIAGDLLHRLGYATPYWWALGPVQRLLMIPYPILVRLGRSLGAIGKAWSGPVEQRLP